MSVAAKTKEVGFGVVGFALLIVVLAIGMALLEGVATFSIWVLRWTFPAFSITFFISIIVLFPLSLIPPARVVSAVGFLFASFAFGTILWLWGMAYTYSTWGILPVVLGLFLGGIGVIPIAMFAALVHGDWANLGLFLVSAALTIGLRVLAHWLAEKADERAARLSATEITAKAYPVHE